MYIIIYICICACVHVYHVCVMCACVPCVYHVCMCACVHVCMRQRTVTNGVRIMEKGKEEGLNSRGLLISLAGRHLFATFVCM